MPENEPLLAAMQSGMRRLFAIASAQEFIIEILLANFIDKLDINQSEAFVRDVMRVGSRTDHLTAKDDREAEVLADVAVMSQEHLQRLVEKALSRAG